MTFWENVRLVPGCHFFPVVSCTAILTNSPNDYLFVLLFRIVHCHHAPCIFLFLGRHVEAQSGQCLLAYWPGGWSLHFDYSWNNKGGHPGFGSANESLLDSNCNFLVYRKQIHVYFFLFASHASHSARGTARSQTPHLWEKPQGVVANHQNQRE